MKIQLQHSAVDDGVTVTLDVNVMKVCKLPPTRAGVRRMADIEITVPPGSANRGILHRFVKAQRETRTATRLVARGHSGLWSIKGVRMPMPGDDLVRITLTYSGSD